MRQWIPVRKGSTVALHTLPSLSIPNKQCRSGSARTQIREIAALILNELRAGVNVWPVLHHLPKTGGVPIGLHNKIKANPGCWNHRPLCPAGQRQPLRRRTTGSGYVSFLANRTGTPI